MSGCNGWAGAVLTFAAALAVGCSGEDPAPPGPTRAAASGGTAPTSLAAVPTTPAPGDRPRTLTIGWTGDTVPASTANGLPPDPGRLFGAVTGLLRAPDLMIGNLEGALTTRGTSKCGPGATSCYAFRSPPAYARLFATAGYDLLSLANNHSHDYGDVGLADTRAAVESAGLATAGLPGQVTVRVVNGIRVAVVGFSPYHWTAPLNDPAAVRALVEAAKARAPVVVVILHGGGEGEGSLHVPPGREIAFGEDRGDLRAFARTAVAAGASVVVGAGPHVVRGMEVVSGRLVAYSLGNFVGWRTLSSSGSKGITAVLTVTLREDGTMVAARIVPTEMVPPGYAAPDPRRRAVELIQRLSVEDFGPTAARIGADGSIAVRRG